MEQAARPGGGRPFRPRWLARPTLRQLRLGSGLVLFAYVLTHLIVHALGNVSLDALESGLTVKAALWRTPPALLLLYGALLLHLALGLQAFYERRFYRVRPAETAQLLLGLAVPMLLLSHVVGTRLAWSLEGLDRGYPQVLYATWVAAPGQGMMQAAGLVVAWLHGCFGLYFWLRLKRGFPRAAPWLLAGAVLVPVLALAWPIKKIAAGAAMLGVTAYCAFSGWDVAAERALIMTLVMLGAILVDRPALTMRNLALAAILALAREPEALLGPSFQMSFGAVAGLIACAPLIDGRVFRTESPSRIARAASWTATAVVGTLATTLVAQVATAPFATYHFQTVQPFGLVGNALTLPLVSLAVMPAAVLGMLAYPFALDRPVWWLMGLAVRGMLDISAWIAGFGQANVVLPAFGTGALVLLAVALLLATLPVSRLRLLALLPAGLGIALAASPARYDIYVDRDGAGAAIRGKDGRLVVLGRPPGFVLEQWLKADGDGRRPDAVTATAGPRCDRLGCTLAAIDGRSVALVTDKRAFSEDCVRADILISRLRAPPGCAAPLIADRSFLAARGATAIRLGPAGPEVVTTRGAGEPKPWQPRAVGAVMTPAARSEPEAARDVDPTDPPLPETPQ
ncbi:ComEC/Rec2 family competence protein [Methylorubrum podarium]|uniref:ComEC/Rec2 family competence protein n=1 Tax=Methylorubrum podarium TaxID=200476 RepID=UPI001EE2CF25|nr:ComEC/Rec2 family competence protein [Methylorubrum podarium]GJE71117.1 hypothetical protein CHKEEEPN_2659 [Methylorubrum podarium]